MPVFADGETVGAVVAFAPPAVEGPTDDGTEQRAHFGAGDEVTAAPGRSPGGVEAVVEQVVDLGEEAGLGLG